MKVVAKDGKSLCLPTTGQIYGTMFGSVWPHLLWIAVNQQHIIGVNPRDHDTKRDLAHSPTPVKVSLGASQLPRSGCRPPLWALVKYRGIILSKGIGLHSLADCSIHPRASELHQTTRILHVCVYYERDWSRRVHFILHPQ